MTSHRKAVSVLVVSLLVLGVSIAVEAAEKLNGFPRNLEASVGVSSPAVGDVDGDKNPDIVVGVGEY